MEVGNICNFNPKTSNYVVAEILNLIMAPVFAVFTGFSGLLLFLKKKIRVKLVFITFFVLCKVCINFRSLFYVVVFHQVILFECFASYKYST